MKCGMANSKSFPLIRFNIFPPPCYRVAYWGLKQIADAHGLPDTASSRVIC